MKTPSHFPDYPELTKGYEPAIFPAMKRSILRNRGLASVAIPIAASLFISTSHAQLTWGANGFGDAGTWDTSSLNWWNGSTAVKWTTGEAIFAGPGGTVTMGSSAYVSAGRLTFLAPGYDLEGFLLHGAPGGLTVDTQADATIGATIFDSSPVAFDATFTKIGSGTLTMTNSPTFYGTIAVEAGELRFANGGFLNGTVDYRLADAPGAILSFDRDGFVKTLSGGGANGGIVRSVDTGTASRTLAVFGNGTIFSGSLQDNGATKLNLEKSSGAGANTSQTLAGMNTYSGETVVSGGTLRLAGNGSALNTSAITIKQGGQLILDNNEQYNRNRLSDTAPITLQGGTMALYGNLNGDAVFERVGALTFSGGAHLNAVGTEGDFRLIFTNLTRSNSGTINFDKPLRYRIDPVQNVNGIIGAYATCGDDWAVNSGAGGGSIVAFTDYATDINTASTTANVRIGGQASLAQNAVRNSLKLDDGNTNNTPSLGLYNNNTLTLSSGGILATGTHPVFINGGTITSTSPTNELVVTNTALLTISSLIANTTTGMALTKSGSGTLRLQGLNTYSGPTTINEGVVEISRPQNLGIGTSVALNGGTLRATDIIIAIQKTLSSAAGTSGTIDTNGNNVYFAASNLSVTKVGDGRLTLYPTNSSADIRATVNAGTLVLWDARQAVVTMNSARLESFGAVGTVYANGTSRIAPGGANTETMAIATLQLNAPTIFEFNIGGSTSDFISITSDYRDFYGTAGALFEFIPASTIELGKAYALMSFSGFNAPTSDASFALTPELIAAGWQATFELTPSTFPSDPRQLTVTFQSIPEPEVLGLLALSGAALLLFRKRRA